MTTATVANNTIEQVRLEVGLTDPQMLRAIGAKKGQLSLLSNEDKSLPPAFIERALELRRAYRDWIADLKAAVVDAGEKRSVLVEGEVCLTAITVASILGLSEFNIVKLAERGQIGSIIQTRRYYPVFAVLAFIDSNSEHLGPDSRHSRAPLATAFLTKYEENRPTP